MPVTDAAPSVTCVMLMTWPKRAAMAAEAVRAFALQTQPDAELLVVNDGAPVRSTDPRARVINLPDRTSLGGKRNTGLVAAQAPYVATWDDDDFSFPERLARQLQVLRRTRGTYVRSARMVIADQALVPFAVRYARCYCTMIVQRDAALAAGGFAPVNYLEDHALYSNLARRAPRGAVTDDLLYVHRRHEANVSRPYESRYRENYGMVYDQPEVRYAADRLRELCAGAPPRWLQDA